MFKGFEFLGFRVSELKRFGGLGFGVSELKGLGPSGFGGFGVCRV